MEDGRSPEREGSGRDATPGNRNESSPWRCSLVTRWGLHDDPSPPHGRAAPCCRPPSMLSRGVYSSSIELEDFSASRIPSPIRMRGQGVPIVGCWPSNKPSHTKQLVGKILWGQTSINRVAIGNIGSMDMYREQERLRRPSQPYDVGSEGREQL
jgi:hypothetical protein